jgi:hypothetical protein
MDKTHLQDLKNKKKHIFNVLELNLDENLILKKKSPNLPNERKTQRNCELKSKGKI